MTKETILRKAIEKAFPKDVPHMWDSLKDDLMFGKRYYEIIFSKDFAKAFWGEEVVKTYMQDSQEEHHFMGGTISYPYNVGAEMEYEVEAWKYHLQQMVLEDDPITYLAKGL